MTSVNGKTKQKTRFLLNIFYFNLTFPSLKIHNLLHNYSFLLTILLNSLIKSKLDLSLDIILIIPLFQLITTTLYRLLTKFVYPVSSNSSITLIG